MMFRRVFAGASAIFIVCGLGGCERWALDKKMEELCRKDGRVTVYETVTLPASDFSTLGEPLWRYASQAQSDDQRYGPDYRYVVKVEFLVGKGADAQRGEGELRRIHEEMFRRADNRLLAESTWYSRGGGDGSTFGLQPTGKICPMPRNDLARATFIKRT
jgi:hypothetical protein